MPTQTRSKPEFDPPTLYARDLVEEFLKTETQVALAKKAGVSGATLNSIRNLSKQAGRHSTSRLAIAFGKTESQFMREAEKKYGHKRREAETADAEVEKPERYHVMPLVYQAAAADGIPEDFVKSFETSLDFDGQPSFSAVYDLLAATWRKERGKLKGRAPEEGDF